MKTAGFVPSIFAAISFAAIVVATLTAAPGCASAPAYLDDRGRFLPRLRLEAGREFSLAVRLNQKLLRTFKGRTRRVFQYYAFTYHFRVLKTDAKRIELRATYRRARIRRSEGGRTADFDSDRPGARVPSQMRMYTTLKGRFFILVLDERGRVLELRGVRDMVAGMIRDLGLKRARERRKYARLIALQFGPDTLRESMRALFTPYPARALLPGESWTATGKLSRGIPLLVERKWTLASLEPNRAVLSADMTLKPDPKAKVRSLGLMRARYSMSGTQRGQSEIDPLSGLLLRGEMRQLLKGHMRLSGGPLRRAIRIPVEIDSRIEYARVP